MRLSSIRPVVSFQGHEQKKQVSSPQQESFIQFGSSKKTPLTIVALMASALYAPNALAVDDSFIPAGKKSETVQIDPLYVSIENQKNLAIITILVSVLGMAFSLPMLFKKDGAEMLDSEAFFKLSAENPKLLKSVHEIFEYLYGYPIDLGEITATEEGRRKIEALSQAASKVLALLDREQKLEVDFATLEISETHLSPVEAFKVYQDSLGPEFNWKPIEKIVAIFIDESKV